MESEFRNYYNRIEPVPYQNSMESHRHQFVELPSAQIRRGYFKQLPNGTYDQSVVYTMLYCPECGETKEVVAADHTHTLIAGLS